MGLQGIERGLERMVEGVFSRAFRSGLRPIELGRRLVREMDEHRSVDVKGHTIVPNDFTFILSPQDHATFSEINDALVRELCDAAREYARDEGYTFMGPMRAGRLAVTSRMHEGQGGVGAGTLVLPAGERIALSEKPVIIGRLPDCEVT